MRAPALKEPDEGDEDAFRLRLRVLPEDLLFEPLRHCRNTNERGRMLLAYALQGYLASVGIQLGKQLQAVVQAGGLVATMTDLRALAGNPGPPVLQVQASPPLKSDPAMKAFTHSPAGSSTAASVPEQDPARRYDVSGLDELALGNAVQF